MSEKTTVTASTYKDIPAITLENGALAIQMLPEFGGKMASLKDKTTGREFLLQAPNAAYLKQPYDGDYTTGECSGFDDMFPTIDPVPYPDFPWKGAVMPDHGEVSALKWTWTQEGDSLTMTTHGLRFPYTLSKTLSFVGPKRLRIAYSATNHSGYPFEYVFATHLMINVEDEGEILLPGAGAATWGFSRFEAKGASYGDKLVWPNATLSTGTVPLNKTPKFDLNGNNYKFFLDEPLAAGWCGYKYPDGTQFTLHFSPEELPAFCIWVNEGWFHGFRNIALEPCSVAYDRIDIARLHGQRSAIEPYSTRTWAVEIEVN